MYMSQTLLGGRCITEGLDCKSWLRLADDQATITPVQPRRKATSNESASEESDDSQGRREKRPRLQGPTEARLDRGSHSEDRTSNSAVPSVVASANLDAAEDAPATCLVSRVVSPRNPLPFRNDPVEAWSSLVTIDTPSPWPRALVRLFKCYGVADHTIYDGILKHTTPKLLSTMLRVCRAIDTLLAASPLSASVPDAPQSWAPARGGWEDSKQCGMHILRVDSNCSIISGVHLNGFWADLAGLHPE
eukprot:1632909-Rhodomonas_salina.1